MFYVDLTNEDKGEEEKNKIEKNESKVNSGKQSYFKLKLVFKLTPSMKEFFKGCHPKGMDLLYIIFHYTHYYKDDE